MIEIYRTEKNDHRKQINLGNSVVFSFSIPCTVNLSLHESENNLISGIDLQFILLIILQVQCEIIFSKFIMISSLIW